MSEVSGTSGSCPDTALREGGYDTCSLLVASLLPQSWPLPSLYAACWCIDTLRLLRRATTVMLVGPGEDVAATPAAAAVRYSTCSMFSARTSPQHGQFMTHCLLCLQGLLHW